MSVLIFPNDPTEGQVYPPDPIPGVNQYFWDSGSETWIQLPACSVPEGVILVETGTGLVGGPITYQGIIEIDDTGVEPGSYTSANITVNAQGQITEASDGSGGASLAVETFVYTTGLLNPGESEQFEINIGRSYQLLNLTADQPVWIRIYGNPYVRDNDSRFSPGPTYPAPGRGFFAEFVTTGAPISMSPVVEVQSEFVNSYFTVQLLPSNPVPTTVTLSFDTIPFVKADVPPLTCSEPPFYCSIDIDPFCVTDFSNAWDGCEDLITFPPLNINAGTDFSNAWRNCVNLTNFPAGIFDSCLAVDFTNAWLNCSLSQQSVDNILISLDAAGQSNGTLNLNGGLSAVPSTIGNAAKLALEGKGWDVTVNEPSPYIYCTPPITYQPVSYPPYFCNTDVNTLGVTSFYEAWFECEYITNFPCVKSASVTDFSYAWEYCYGLTSFPAINTGSGTNFTYTWGYCTDLTSFPLINTSSATNFYGTWCGCYVLSEMPLVDSSNVTDFTYAWYYCYSLVNFPALDMSQGTDFYYTWENCNSLTSFPLLDVSSGINFEGAWSYCESLTAFPQLDVSQGTNFSNTWYYCNSLTSFPPLDVSQGIYFYGAWEQCINLTSFPGTLDLSSGTIFDSAWFYCGSLISFPGTLDLSSGTDFGAAWFNCYSLTSFPGTLDLSSGTDFQQSWNNCTSLTSFPLLDVSNGTDFGGAWWNCTSLTTFPAGMFDSCLATQFYNAWQNCALDETSVDNILVSLDTAGQSNGEVSISGGTSSPPGTAGLAAKASLEGKGWTVLVNVAVCDYPPYGCSTAVNPYCVTDFTDAWNGCYALTSFPLLNVSSGTNFNGTWAFCSGLTTLPLLNTSSGTTFAGAWYNCDGLTSFPALNLSLGTSFNAAWAGCYDLTSFPSVNVSSGQDFAYAWTACNSLTSFPSLSLNNGTSFVSTWQGCILLTSFPASMFDTCLATDFTLAWRNCALDQTSVDNILTSINTANTNNGVLFIDSGTTSTPGSAGMAAISSLVGRGWVVNYN